MADSYSDRLGLIKMEEGAHSNDWGDLANLNFDRLDSAIRGYKKITLAGAETLDSNDITSTSSVAQEESFFAFIEFVGTAGTVTVPAEDMVWIVKNSTGSDFTFQPSGGTGVTIPNGDTRIVVYGSNGASFTDMTSSLQLKGDEIKTLYEGEADTNAFTDADHTKLDGIEAGADVTDTTNVTAAGALMTTGGTMTGNINLGDNDKAIFGAGSDLQIYHDGSNSYIQDQGTGKLILAGTDLALTDADGYAYIECSDTGVGGGVAIKHAAVTKLATTSTGIDVTGTVVADEVKVEAVDGLSIMSGTAVEASWTHTAGTGASVINVGRNTSWGGDLMIQTDLKNRAHFESNGDISFYEDTGTTAKFFWDASLEALGVGITPSTAMHVYSASGNTALRVETGLTNGQAQINFKNDARRYNVGINSSDNLVFEDDTAGLTRMVIDSSGNVGIGTSSPNSKLTVYGGETQWGATSGLGVLSYTGGAPIVGSIGAIPLLFYTNTAERMRIDSSGNVGIGTTSPSSYPVAPELVVDTGSNGGITIKSGTGGGSYGGLYFADGTTGDEQYRGFIQYNHNNTSVDALLLGTAGTERMRIDSSGNLLVGKTSSSFSTVGVEATSTGKIRATMSSDNPISLNRTTTDGGIAVFAKDGATVGAIGTEGGDLAVGTGDVGLKFNDASGLISPWDMTANAPENGTIDLGYATGRFKDAYLSGGIYLGGTGAANKLDDYEEGTHVATVTPSTSGTITLTSTIDTLGYTKIGRQVTITGYLNVQSVSSPVGSYVSVTLPFSIGGVNERGEDIGGAAQVYDYSVGGWIAAPFDGIYGNVGIRVYYPVASTQGGTIFRFSFSYFTLA